MAAYTIEKYCFAVSGVLVEVKCLLYIYIYVCAFVGTIINNKFILHTLYMIAHYMQIYSNLFWNARYFFTLGSVIYY